MVEKNKIVTGGVYHVLNKSIAGFKIFNSDNEFLRMRNMLRYYQHEDTPYRFSQYILLETVQQLGFDKCFTELQLAEKSVQIIAYCLMPTHIHLAVKQLKNNGISTFMSSVLNSYARYFNIKHRRKGPLWEGRFKRIIVETDEYLLHLTRYIHLNPVTAYLVDKPEKWQFSSYNEYLKKADKYNEFCEYSDIMAIEPNSYRKFVRDQASFQRDLARLKKLFLE